MLRLSVLLGLVLALTPPVHAHPETSAQTTYLGNEGILVSDAHTRILFDPLYPNGFGTYQLVPETIRNELMAGSAPYNDIDAIFVSHMHGDHFSVGEMIVYLQRHSEVRLYAPAQAVELMRSETEDEGIFERVTAIQLERLDDPLSFSEGGLTVDVVRIPHAGWPGRAEVSNLVWRVTLSDGVTVMHLGDADPQDSHYAPHAQHWTKVRSDVAYPPYWFYLSEEGQRILSTRLNTRDSTGIHVPIKLPPGLLASGEDFFHVPGETRKISGPKR